MRLGVVGTNWITDTLIQAAKDVDSVDIQAVCSRSNEKGSAFASKHNIPFVYTSMKEMCNSGEIDGVYIATPNAVHHEQTIECLEAGIPVLCEKPLTATYDLAEKMVQASRQNGVLLMEAMKSTLMPNFKRVQELLPSLGAIRQYSAHYGQYSSRYDKFKAGDIQNAFKPEMANGSLMDLGVYTLYPLVKLFGMPEEVKAISTNLHTGVDGQGMVLLSYGEMNAVITFSKITNSYLPSEIAGEEAALHISHIGSPDGVRRITKEGGSEDLTVEQSKAPMAYELEEFVRAYENGQIESSINTHELSLNVVALLQTIRQQIGIVYPLDKRR
ncbi:Gfo/Idh/MocA family oxidoreductase [Jeotgalibacillus sp. S-D1]|uniref:Gfo/Idh/MocA family protein n=1 Tax=Jeotgalibacillus sp. S-D1 TaxID=2552189 RepID=UPI00105A8916|nr:Gfo/Idh/MocA family oxidoreductase [Jeotgalibacillus sp. S-D1]TDL31451.1 Gfo/Idh/MocA family oxidoreductase [Jeotgalibacillus sp. S-D1]